MSFFIRPTNSIKRNGLLIKQNKFKKKKISTQSGERRKVHASVNRNEELESDNESLEPGGTEDVYESDDAQETAQEKKLRLAKLYLEEIERKERAQKDYSDVDKGVITNFLKEDLKEKTQRSKKAVADLYVGFHEENIKTLCCKDHRAPVTCIVISSDNKYIYSASKDSAIVKWSLAAGTKLKSVKKWKNPEGASKLLGTVLCLAISSDSKYLVSGGTKNEIHVWNPDTLMHLHVFNGHKGSITGLAFQRNHHTLYSASSDRSVKVWNLVEMAYVETLFGHQRNITSVDALIAERALTSSEDASVRIWKIVEESQLLYMAPGSVDCVKFVNEDHFLSCGDDGSLCLWGVLKKKPLSLVQKAHGVDSSNQQPNWISSIAALVNTDLVASGSKDGAVKLWKCAEGFKKLHHLFDIPVAGFVNGIAFTSNGDHLIVAVAPEHRLGRWWKLDVKNCILIIPLLRTDK